MLQPKLAFLASLEKEEYDIQYQVHKTICALEAQQEKPTEKTPEELVPKEYHKFLKVFLKKKSKCMPLQKPWDHAIDLKDMFKLKKGHIIPLSSAEQEEVTAFLDDQLKKGYIHMSFQIPPNVTGVLCSQERWKDTDGTGLLIPKQTHSQKQLPIAIDCTTS